MGLLSPKQLARNEEELYFDEKTKIKIKQIQVATVEEGLGGFYSDMKKKINIDACQKSLFCDKYKAYHCSYKNNKHWLQHIAH